MVISKQGSIASSKMNSAVGSKQGSRHTSGNRNSFVTTSQKGAPMHMSAMAPNTVAHVPGKATGIQAGSGQLQIGLNSGNFGGQSRTKAHDMIYSSQQYQQQQQ